MGMTSALKLDQAVPLAKMVLAIELLTATRALDLRGDTTTTTLEDVRTRFRARFRHGVKIASCQYGWNKPPVFSRKELSGKR